MAEKKQDNGRGRAIFDLVFTALLVGISMGAGPVGIIAMQYTSDRISYWHGAIGGSSLAVLVVAGYLLYQDWKGPRRIFRKASEPGVGGVGGAGERDRPGSGETPGASSGGTG